MVDIGDEVLIRGGSVYERHGDWNSKEYHKVTVMGRVFYSSANNFLIGYSDKGETVEFRANQIIPEGS